MTAWQTIQVDLRNAGAEAVDEEVVDGGYLVTSRKSDGLEAFTREAFRVPERTPAGHAWR